jgi:hypothetical protein
MMMNSVERGFNGNTIATTSNNEVQSRQVVRVLPPGRVCNSQFKRATGYACQVNMKQMSLATHRSRSIPGGSAMCVGFVC